MTYSVEQWKWAIVKVLMRNPSKPISKEEINIEAKKLLDEKTKDRNCSP